MGPEDGSNFGLHQPSMEFSIDGICLAAQYGFSAVLIRIKNQTLMLNVLFCLTTERFI